MLMSGRVCSLKFTDIFLRSMSALSGQESRRLYYREWTMLWQKHSITQAVEGSNEYTG
jgi:hypothetical protein